MTGSTLSVNCRFVVMTHSLFVNNGVDWWRGKKEENIYKYIDGVGVNNVYKLSLKKEGNSSEVLHS